MGEGSADGLLDSRGSLHVRHDLAEMGFKVGGIQFPELDVSEKTISHGHKPDISSRTYVHALLDSLSGG